MTRPRDEHEIELTREQREELDQRLEDYRRDPTSGMSWEAVCASLRRTPRR